MITLSKPNKIMSNVWKLTIYNSKTFEIQEFILIIMLIWAKSWVFITSNHANQPMTFVIVEVLMDKLAL